MKILDATVKMTYSDGIRDSLVFLIVAVLTAANSDLTVWVGAGRRAIEHYWESSPSLSVILSAALFEAAWGGFKQFALPPFMKNLQTVLLSTNSSKLAATRLLAQLAKGGSLKGMDGATRTFLATEIKNLLSTFTVSEASVNLFEFWKLIFN